MVAVESVEVVAAAAGPVRAMANAPTRVVSTAVASIAAATLAASFSGTVTVAGWWRDTLSLRLVAQLGGVRFPKDPD